MEIKDIGYDIQTLLTPVLMISACGLLLLSVKHRYSRINDRLRGLTRERLEILPARGEEKIDRQLRTIEAQLPGLLKRNKILRDALLALYLGIIAFVLVIH